MSNSNIFVSRLRRVVLTAVVVVLTFTSATILFFGLKSQGGGLELRAPLLGVPLMTAENGGRLGNQMFSYATLWAVAKYKGRRALLHPGSEFLKKYFKVSMMSFPKGLDDFRKIEWTVRTFSLQDFKAPEIEASNLHFIGHPESWKYFYEFRDVILKEFEFHDNFTLRAQEIIVQAKTQFFPEETTGLASKNESNGVVVVVGVHVRRGDYVQLAPLTNMLLPTKEFYVGAMNYFSGKFKNNVLFIVASDEIEWWVKEFGQNSTNKTPTMPTTPELPRVKVKLLTETSKEEDEAAVIDLAVRARCDHNIFGFGTYGFWGAYLSGGETIFCADCMADDSLLVVNLEGDFGNFVLPGWIGFNRDGSRSTAGIPQRRVLTTASTTQRTPEMPNPAP